jgi:hypothetical protein
MRYLKTMISLVSIVILSSATTAIIVYVATFQSAFRLDPAMPVVHAGGRSVLARLARSWCADIYSVQVYFSRPDHLAPDPNIRDMPDYLALSQTAKFDPRPVILLVQSLFYKSPVKYEVDIGCRFDARHGIWSEMDESSVGYPSASDRMQKCSDPVPRSRRYIKALSVSSHFSSGSCHC